jgi:DNA (cytosine-5)-methyltransferase 1
MNAREQQLQKSTQPTIAGEACVTGSLSHGSLFSGIGGFELGAEYAGIKTLWNCEFETFQQNILKKHFKDNEQYTDVRTANISERVDIISGGFPCQDISVAGKMEGIKGERSGLWSEMFRIIRNIRPKYVIIENSPALLIRGFEQVLCDLSEIGYSTEWQCISNASFGYPHKRERLYAIAYSNEVRLQSDICTDRTFDSIFKKWASNSAYGYSLSQRIHKIRSSEIIRNGNGFSNWTHRVGSVGNAVNPTLAYYLFECIKSHHARFLNCQ